MALQKDHEQGSKKGNYWKIIGNHSNTMYQSTVVRVALYENKEARDKDETSYVKVLLVCVPGVDHTRETAYKELKTKAEFEGSIDV